MSVAQRCVIPLLCGILVMGFLVRIYHVDTNPAGFFCDEASIGYNTYTLLTTGRDEHGVQYPLFFQSFGDYRPPIPYYAAIPFVLIFGLHEFAVRVTTASVGTLSILIVYLFLKMLLSYTRVVQKLVSAGSLFGAFFLAISPWHIHMSRFGSEYIYLPLFVLLAALVFLLSYQKPTYIPLAFFVSGLIGYTYLPGLIIGPIFTLLVSLSSFSHLKRNWKYTLIGVGIYCIVLIPTIQAVGNKTLLTRWNSVGLGKETSILGQIKTFSTQYIEHFSPVFLFTKGDIGYPGHFINRFSVKGVGQLYIVDGLFLCIGFIFLLIQIKKKNISAMMPIVLLILYPIGSSVTTTDGGGPLAFRSVLGSIVFPVISAIGITVILNTITLPHIRRLWIGLLSLIYIIFFLHYLYLYHTQYPLYSQDFWGWQFGPRDIMQTFLTNKGAYDEYLIIGEFNSPDIFIKFYDPTNQCGSRCRVAGISDINPQKRQLIALSPSAWQQASHLHLTIKKTIFYPNGQPAYYIVTTP